MRETFYLPWNKAYERGEGMYNFFTETMQFDSNNVKKFINLSKDEIITELVKLNSLAYDFDIRQKEE